jgi:outer membrane protein assembly factor BamB
MQPSSASFSAVAIRQRWIVLALAAALAAPAGARAGNWPGWRGPTGVGLSDEKGLPLTWGWAGKKKDNVLWKVDIGGRGYSSPIVWGDRVFVTTGVPRKSADKKKRPIPDQYVVCYRAKDGKELWRTQVPRGPLEDENVAVPTPATDGQRVYAWFGTGVLAALDYDGKIVWRQERRGKFYLNPAMSSSPLVYRDRVILLCAHGGNKDSFVQALDAKTGELKWDRPLPRTGTTNASPFLIRAGGKEQLILCTGRALRALDPAEGKELWSCAINTFVPSPAYGGGLLYVDHGAEGAGVAISPTGKGDVSKTQVKWKIDRVGWGYASPIIVGDHVYRAQRPGLLRCWRLSDGEEVYSKRLEGISTLSSPVATADGRIYFACAAKSFVIKAGPKFELLATSTLPGGDNGPSPAVANGRLFLKSETALFCIGRE